MREYPMSEPNTFFTPQQRRIVAAAMARIIPTDDTPGAAEADTITYVDRYLSGIDYIYAKPDGSGFETLTGMQATAWQQRVDILRGKYEAGIVELEALSASMFDDSFVNLSSSQQDAVLAAMEQREEGSDPALQQTSEEINLDFFPLLCVHTRQGFLADPIYGGNKGQAGWQTIGFPGPKSLKDVHDGSYSVLAWFAEGHNQPTEETADDA